VKSAIFRNANVVRLGRACLSMLPLALFLAVAAGHLYAQNPATSVSVDASANRHPINPNIYGVGMFMDSNDNVLPADLAAVNAPIHRFGGDLNSTYNWQQDAWNLSHDWYWESYLLSSPLAQGGLADSFILNTRAANVGSEPAITIPMLGYIAKAGPNATTGAASLWSYSIAKYGAQTGADPWQPDAGNGISAATGQPILTNDPAIAYVPNSVAIQQGWLQHLLAKWGTSTTSTGVKYYILDNEPSIWSGTHQDVHPKPETYDELYNAIVAYAGAIRAADPNAKIIGPEEWSWWAMWESGHDQANGTGAGSDYATHNNTYYYPWLLQQLYKYRQTTGIKLIDVLSVHCYNAIPGGGDDAATQKQRNQQTRMLWDPTFVDSGDWQTGSGLNNGVEEYIPLMKSWVNQYYPGLEIGCTEYNWGDDAALNGATTQADVLGIYGAYGFDMAAIYGVPAYPTFLSFQIYRNYDGKLSTFGDTSVPATVANPDNLSSFAALRSQDGALTVMVINKQTGSTPVTISLANFASTGTAQVYQISSATQTKIDQLANVTVANNAIGATVPSQSITLFVIPAGAVTSKPTAPAGLAAAVGNGAVTLTWNASGGATSYTVQRGTVSGGPYTAIGTVASPSPTTFTDTGLTNGATYYYVVSGTNSIGAGPNSSEVAATPLAPPTFSSSASASPNPVAQNASTTITATVKCTANTLSNGSVQVVALDPTGATAASKSFTAQSFTTNQTQTYSLALTPALAGTYTVQIGVFGAAGQQWSLNSSAAAITVNSSLSFTSSATAAPPAVAVGGTSVVSLTVTANGTSGLANSNVELQIFNQGGTAVATQVWSSQTFAAGQALKYSYSWTPASTVAAGTYTVMIGVFDSTWSTDYYWNNSAATITITSAPAAPSAPTGLTATAGNASVALSWAAAGGAATYNVYRGTAAGAESNTPIATGVATTSYNDTGLTNGARYYYKVAAVNAGGTSALSTEASATPQVSAPSAPTGLTATAGNASVALSWAAAGGAATYSVYRGTAAGAESNTPIATGVATTSYNDTGLTNGAKYYYKVAAVNAGGTSALSTEASATPQAPAPSSIVATAGGGQSAQVNTTFLTAFQATVKDAGGNPVAGVAVTFTAPGSGASGKFGAALSASATTNAQGVATAPAFTANATAGTYGVTAGVSGAASTASFALTNTAASSSTQVTNASAVYSPASQSVKLAATVSSASAPVTGGTVAFTVTGLGSATAAVANGQAVAAFQIPAGSAAGSYAVSASYSGDADAASSVGSGALTIAKANPVLTWNNPASVVSGTPLGAAQLDATANVAGSFVYSPPAGAVLPVGNNQQLKVSFTPANGADYNSATMTVTISVTQAAGSVRLTVSSELTRDSATKAVTVRVTVTNSGAATAAGVQVTRVEIGGAVASGLPISLGAIAPGKSAAAVVHFPASVGGPGARHHLTIAGTYTGGQFESVTRVVLP